MLLNEPLLTQLPCNLGELPIPQVLSVTTKKSGPVSNTCHPDLFAATAIVNDHPIHYVESEIQKVCLNKEYVQFPMRIPKPVLYGQLTRLSVVRMVSRRHSGALDCAADELPLYPI